jgi:hypothetical protein
MRERQARPRFKRERAARNRVGVVGLARAKPLSVRVRPVERTCKPHHSDPFAYLLALLRRLLSQPEGLLEELLPNVWLTSHPSARR